MALSYNVKTNVALVNISNTEVLITQNVFLPCSTIAVGDTIRITLAGLLALPPPAPAPNFNINFRVGVNGTIADAALLSVNNIVAFANLFNDVNNFAQTFPGVTGTVYGTKGAYNLANFPAIQQPPVKIDGTILAVAISQAANSTNLAFIVQPDRAAPNNSSLFALLNQQSAEGVLGYGTFQSNVNNFICVTASELPANYLTYVGQAQGNVSTPGSAFAANTGANANGVVTFSSIEVL